MRSHSHSAGYVSDDVGEKLGIVSTIHVCYSCTVFVCTQKLVWLDVDRTGLINVVDLFFLLKVCAFFLQCRKKRQSSKVKRNRKQ